MCAVALLSPCTRTIAYTLSIVALPYTVVRVYCGVYVIYRCVVLHSSACTVAYTLSFHRSCLIQYLTLRRCSILPCSVAYTVRNLHGFSTLPLARSLIQYLTFKSCLCAILASSSYPIQYGMWAQLFCTPLRLPYTVYHCICYMLPLLSRSYDTSYE